MPATAGAVRGAGFNSECPERRKRARGITDGRDSTTKFHSLGGETPSKVTHTRFTATETIPGKPTPKPPRPLPGPVPLTGTRRGKLVSCAGPGLREPGNSQGGRERACLKASPRPARREGPAARPQESEEAARRLRCPSAVRAGPRRPPQRAPRQARRLAGSARPGVSRSRRSLPPSGHLPGCHLRASFR